MRTPRLETKRLKMRPFREEDAEAVFNGWETDPDVARYMMWESHNDIKKTEAWIAEEIGNIEKEDWFRWAIDKKDTGELIGTCLIYYSEEESSYVIGYNIVKKHWNKGFTTEAMKEAMKYAKDDLNLKTILGSHSVENPASGAVMEKLGMKYSHECEYICNGGKIKTKGRTYRIEF